MLPRLALDSQSFLPMLGVKGLSLPLQLASICNFCCLRFLCAEMTGMHQPVVYMLDCLVYCYWVCMYHTVCTYTCVSRICVCVK